MIITNSPIGRMNTDDSFYRIPKGEVPYRLNQRVGFGNGANIGVSENLKGNIQVSSPTLPTGTNTCIGSYNYEKGKKIYYFIHNTNGFHTIYEYDYLADATVKILQDLTDTNGVSVLNFSLLKRINHINILDGDEYLNTEDSEVTFTLTTTSDDMLGTSAEILTTGDIITEGVAIHSTQSITVNLELTTNIVRVSMPVTLTTTDTATITVNGETRTIPSLTLTTWVEDFIVVGFNDIIVSAFSGTVVVPPAVTGAYMFTNQTTSFPVNLTAVYVNASLVGGLAPHGFPAVAGEALFAIPPTGITIVDGNNNISFETSLGGNVAMVKLLIESVEIGSRLIGPTEGSGTFITPLLSNDDVVLQLDSATTAVTGTWLFENSSHPTSDIVTATVNAVSFPPLSPNNFPLSVFENGAIVAPGSIKIFNGKENLIRVTTTDTTGNGFLTVVINNGTPVEYVTEVGGVTNITQVLNANDSVEIFYNTF